MGDTRKESREPSFPGFMLFMSKVVGARRWTGAILFSGVTTFVSYFLFVYWLKFFADKGIFGIY